MLLHLVRRRTVDASRMLVRSVADASVEHTEEHKLTTVFSQFKKEDADKILDVINNKSAEELFSYDVSKVRANKLLAWKKRNGPLQQLQDILHIDGFGLKVVEKFYRSMLVEPTARETKINRVRTAPFITPHMEEEQRQAIRSCVAVRIGVASATWTRLELPDAEEINTPCLLTDWRHHDIVEKKLHLGDLVQRCLYVDHLIPNADCYLFENPLMAQASSNPGSVDQQNVNIQKAQVIAMLSYALAARQRCNYNLAEQMNHKPKMRPCVFYLRRFLSARLFNHLVGTERVSSEDSVLQLMRTYYNTDAMEDSILDNEQQANVAATTRLTFRGNVQFPADLREMFSNAGRYQREFLSQSLLLNLAFMRLVLLQDADSLALVSRSNKSVKAKENPL